MIKILIMSSSNFEDFNFQDDIWIYGEIKLQDRYLIKKMLGQGGFGAVYKVESLDRNPGKFYAAKFIIEEDSYNNEVGALLRLSNSPNCSDYVVCMVEHGKVNNDDTEYGVIIMELLQGDLQSLIGKYDEKLPDEIKYLIMLKLLRALDYIHSQNLAHRDIKANNVLYSDDGNIIKLSDVGLVCQDEAAGGIPRCSPHGDIEFMEPQMQKDMRSKKKFITLKEAQEADVWSMGKLFAYILFSDHVNKFSYAQENLDKLLTNLINKEIDALKFYDFSQDSESRGYVKILSIIKAMMEPERSKRITLSQVLELMEQLFYSQNDNRYNCQNEKTFYGNKTLFLNDEQIYLYPSGENEYYCFDIGDVLFSLKNNTNPYTGETLNRQSIDDMKIWESNLPIRIYETEDVILQMKWIISNLKKSVNGDNILYTFFSIDDSWRNGLTVKIPFVNGKNKSEFVESLYKFMKENPESFDEIIENIETIVMLHDETVEKTTKLEELTKIVIPIIAPDFSVPYQTYVHIIEKEKIFDNERDKWQFFFDYMNILIFQDEIANPSTLPASIILIQELPYIFQTQQIESFLRWVITMMIQENYPEDFIIDFIKNKNIDQDKKFLGSLFNSIGFMSDIIEKGYNQLLKFLIENLDEDFIQDELYEIWDKIIETNNIEVAKILLESQYAGDSPFMKIFREAGDEIKNLVKPRLSDKEIERYTKLASEVFEEI